MSNSRLQLTVEMLMQLTSNIIKTAGLNMSQKCFVNTRPLIQSEIEDVEFHKPKRVNVSGRVSISLRADDN